MGLNSSIKQLVTKAWAVITCLHSKAAAVRGQPRDTHVHIVDYLTKFRAMADVESYTLPLLADNLVHQIKGPTSILVCDCRAKVPKLKAGTQAARIDAVVKASAKRGLDEATPYPRGAEWDFATGWVKWTEQESCPDDETKMMDVPKLEPINLPRLAKSRWYGAPDDPRAHSNLGNELWATMHDRLQQVVTLSNSCRQVIFDYKHEGPVVFDKSDKSGLLLESMAHNLGEADTALVWWAAQYDGKVDHIHLHTCDGDQMALYALYHDQRSASAQQRTKIWWHCDHDNVVDLCQMVTCMLGRDFLLKNGQTRRFPSARHIGVFFILCGTDFFSQRVVAFGNGVDKMLQAFLMIDWPAFSELEDWAAPSIDKPSPLLDHVLREWMVRMFHYKLPGGKVQVPEAFRKPPQPLVSMDSIRRRHREKEEASFDALCFKQKTAYEAELDPSKLRALEADQKKARDGMWRFPEEEEVHWAAMVLSWNYEYWRAAASGAAVPEPSRPRIRVALAHSPAAAASL